MIDERTSAWVSRAEVREKIDSILARNGRNLAPGRRSEPTEEEIAAEREARLNDPANEQGAASLMAVAAGARRS